MTGPRVSVSVMAHPRRAAAARDIARACGTLPARVVLDPEPGGPPSTVRTARLAWRPWSPGATHHLVLQDDVTLPPDLDRHVLAAVTAQPDAALSFFSEWGSFTSHALRIGAYGGYPWVRQPDTYLATQALVLPVGHAEALAGHLGTADLTEPDDHVVHRYASAAGLPHLVSNPNLVEHDAGSSLIGNGEMGARRATVPLAAEAPLPPSWWRGDALTSLTRVPSVFWRDPVPSSYEQGPDAGAAWTLAPARRTFGTQHDEVTGRVHALLRSALDGPGGADLLEGPVGAALPGVAVVTAAQVAVARSLRARPASATAAAGATQAARTVAPGALRRLDPRGTVDWDRVARALVQVARRVEDDVLATLDLDDLARAHTSGPAPGHASARTAGPPSGRAVGA